MRRVRGSRSLQPSPTNHSPLPHHHHHVLAESSDEAWFHMPRGALIKLRGFLRQDDGDEETGEGAAAGAATMAAAATTTAGCSEDSSGDSTGGTSRLSSSCSGRSLDPFEIDDSHIQHQQQWQHQQLQWYSSPNQPSWRCELPERLVQRKRMQRTTRFVKVGTSSASPASASPSSVAGGRGGSGLRACCNSGGNGGSLSHSSGGSRGPNTAAGTPSRPWATPSGSPASTFSVSRHRRRSPRPPALLLNLHGTPRYAALAPYTSLSIDTSRSTLPPPSCMGGHANSAAASARLAFYSSAITTAACDDSSSGNSGGSGGVSELAAVAAAAVSSVHTAIVHRPVARRVRHALDQTLHSLHRHRTDHNTNGSPLLFLEDMEHNDGSGAATESRDALALAAALSLLRNVPQHSNGKFNSNFNSNFDSNFKRNFKGNFNGPLAANCNSSFEVQGGEGRQRAPPAPRPVPIAAPPAVHAAAAASAAAEAAHSATLAHYA